MGKTMENKENGQNTQVCEKSPICKVCFLCGHSVPTFERGMEWKFVDCCDICANEAHEMYKGLDDDFDDLPNDFSDDEDFLVDENIPESE